MSLSCARLTCRRPTAFTPRVEMLEQRCLPTCLVTQAGSVLTILGSNGRDQVRVGDDGTGDVTVLCDQGRTAQVFHGVSAIRIDLKGGSDAVHYDLLGNVNGGRSLTVKLGGGADSFVGYLNGNDLLPGADYRINVDGGPGADRISLRFDTDPDSQTVALLTAGLSLPTFTLFATPGVDIAPGARFTVHLTGGPGNDAIAFKYQGSIQGTLSATADGGPGNDRVSTVINADAGSAGKVTARVLGGPGADTLRLAVTEPPGGALTVDGLVDGGPGFDHSDHTLNVAERNCESNTLESPFTPAV